MFEKKGGKTLKSHSHFYKEHQYLAEQKYPNPVNKHTKIYNVTKTST